MFLVAMQQNVYWIRQMIEIIPVETEQQIADAKKLFREYEAWFGMDLCFQGFEEELRGLPGKYVSPNGRLLLATVDDDSAGCIAMRGLDKEICEMKRLYVRDKFRGHALGRLLIERIINEAKIAGYKKMRLDTFPQKMGRAVNLYRTYDFYEIPAYYSNPYEGVLFMEKLL
jgi:putative acetyltransferase